MEGLFIIGLLVVVTALAMFDVLAVRVGVDSRLESADPRSPVPGITT